MFFTIWRMIFFLTQSHILSRNKMHDIGLWEQNNRMNSPGDKIKNGQCSQLISFHKSIFWFIYDLRRDISCPRAGDVQIKNMFKYGKIVLNCIVSSTVLLEFPSISGGQCWCEIMCNQLHHQLHMLLCPCWVSGGLSREAQTRISGSSGPAEPCQRRLEFISAGPVLLCLATQPNYSAYESCHISPPRQHHQTHCHIEADRSQPMRRKREESGDEVTVRLG